MSTSSPDYIPGQGPDAWESLKRLTEARIALGRAGSAVPLNAWLQFKMAHAHARDAVYSSLDMALLQDGLTALEMPFVAVQSAVQNRDEYLQRPDLGRILDNRSQQELNAYAHNRYDLAIVIADGLSAMAVNQYALPVVQELKLLVVAAGWCMSPICLAQQSRVAIGDPVGSLLQAEVVVVLIGERPGLSAPASLGAYITYQPKPGLTDESRNCISNIRNGGLSKQLAAAKIMYLLQEARRLRLSGVGLKDIEGGLLEG